MSYTIECILNVRLNIIYWNEDALLCIIFFEAEIKRPGTHNDAEFLESVLTSVRFDVTLHKDKTFEEIFTIMRDGL